MRKSTIGVVGFCLVVGVTAVEAVGFNKLMDISFDLPIEYIKLAVA